MSDAILPAKPTGRANARQKTGSADDSRPCRRGNRIEAAMSACGRSRHFVALRNLVATGATWTSTGHADQAQIMSTRTSLNAAVQEIPSQNLSDNAFDRHRFPLYAT